MNGVSPQQELELSTEPLDVRTELPQMFGPYLLIEQAEAEGGADEFKAIALDRRAFGRSVSVRITARALPETSLYARRLGEEAIMAKRLDHPNIVRVVDFGQVSGTYYLATQHVESRDLRTVMRALRQTHLCLQPAPVAQIVHAVARGLEYAHELTDSHGFPYGIVHRHLNPGSIMVGRKGGVKIANFGIVDPAELPSQIHSTVRRGMQRRVRYFSPEQARGEALDGRSDVFSLGVIMWELLTGRRLFDGASVFESIGNLLHAPIERPSRTRPTLPPELDDIVMRALERDRALRYDAGEMARDLEAFMQAHEIRKDALRYILTTLFGNDPPPSSAHRPAATADADTVVARVPGDPARREDLTVPDWPNEPASTVAPPVGPLISGLGSTPQLPLPAHLRVPMPPPPPMPPLRRRLTLRSRRVRWAGAVLLVLGFGGLFSVLHHRPLQSLPSQPPTALPLEPQIEFQGRNAPPVREPEPAPVPEIAIQVAMPRGSTGGAAGAGGEIVPVWKKQLQHNKSPTRRRRGR